MKDDQRKGEGLRSDGDGDGDGGLSFLLGLVFFSVVMMIFLPSDPSSLITEDEG